VRRAAAALGFPLALLALAAAALPVLALGRADRRTEVGRALSRLLSALTTGAGDTTFSADSWRRRLAGRWDGAARVRVVDALNEPGHCEAAWQWHQARGLIRWQG